MGRAQGFSGSRQVATARGADESVAEYIHMLEVVSDTGETSSAEWVAGLVESLTPHPPHEEYYSDVRSQIERHSEYSLVAISVASALELSLPTDEGTVAKYVAAIAAGEALDPIVFVEAFGSPGSAPVLLDGCHRLRAADESGLEAIEAYVPSVFWLD